MKENETVVSIYRLSVKSGPFWLNTRLIILQDVRRNTHEELLQLFSVSIPVMLEKPSSHRYVVEKSRRAETALFATKGNSFATISQKPSKGKSAKLCFSSRFCLSSVISSCSCKVKSFPTAAELSGLLTRSGQSVEREGK